jgi:hypothetical protein
MTDLTPNDLSHLSDEEFNALCPQGHHATGPAKPLSPAAQAVKDAVLALYADQNVHKFGWQLDAPTVAAALRALSYQCLHETPKGVHGHHARRYMLAGELQAIASELEKTND